MLCTGKYKKKIKIRSWRQINVTDSCKRTNSFCFAFVTSSKASELKFSRLIFSRWFKNCDGWYSTGLLGRVFCKFGFSLEKLHLLFLNITLFSTFKISWADNLEAHSLSVWIAAHSFSEEISAPFFLNRDLWKFNSVKPPQFFFFGLSLALLCFVLFVVIIVCCSLVLSI